MYVCMKIARTYTIEKEIIDKLEGLNASGLINELLKSYFNGDLPDDINILRQLYEEKRQKKAILLKEMRNISAKIGKKQAEIEEKRQENMTENEKIARKMKNEEMLKLWQAEEISDEEYWRYHGYDE